MPQFSFDDSIGFLVNRTAVFLRRELQQAFARNGHSVTPEQWALLNRLWQHDGLSQVQLAELTFKDKPNVTRMIRVLEGDGLVSRRPDENDRRANGVWLTDKGRRLEQDLVPLAEELLTRALKGIDEDGIAHLRTLLAQIDRNLIGGSS
jgi:MarR family transcriptional regulator, organic hydroperoxide resistance regulator